MRMIDADALKEYIRKKLGTKSLNFLYPAEEAIVKCIDQMPTIEPERGWIPFKFRPITDEEKEAHPEWDYIFECDLPEDGQNILVTIKYKGHTVVGEDVYYDGDRPYFDSGYEIGTEVVAWMPLPEPYKERDDAAD